MSRKENPLKCIKAEKFGLCHSCPVLALQDNFILSYSFADGKNTLFFEMYNPMTHLSLLCGTKLLSCMFWLPKNTPFILDPLIFLLFWKGTCLLPAHHQINLNLDNSEYLLFSSYSHTCPHSTSHIQCLPTLISSWKTSSSHCSKIPLWIMRWKLTLPRVLQTLMIHNRFYLHCVLWRRNCCRWKKLSDLPKVIKKVNG